MPGRLKWWMKLAFVGALLFGALAMVLHLNLMWNVSPSLPEGLYRIDESVTEYRRGDLVVACLPPEVGKWAMDRGYLSKGSCPGDTLPVGKYIAAVAGDLVEVNEQELRINGVRLKGFARDGFDSRDRPVPLVKEGAFMVSRWRFWLHSGRVERSLDSRVYGPIDVVCIRGVLRPLWIRN